MRIALSSAAFPTASLAELIDGCQRRGLSALHLIAGHGHGISDSSTDAELARAHQLAQSAGVSLVSIEPDAGHEDVARISSARHAVPYGTPSAAPCWNDTPSGSGSRPCSSVSVIDAYAPYPSATAWPYTRAPTTKRVTPGPTASTTPA